MKTQYRILERLGVDGRMYYEIETRGGLPWPLAFLCLQWDLMALAFDEKSAREAMDRLARSDAQPARVIAHT